MQTKEGGQAVRNTMIRKFGSYEKYREWMASIGSQGGARNKGGEVGFGSYVVGADGKTGRIRARIAGRLGGLKSRRKADRV